MPSPSRKRVRITSLVNPEAATTRSSSVAGSKRARYPFGAPVRSSACATVARYTASGSSRRLTAPEARLSTSCSRACRARSSASAARSANTSTIRRSSVVNAGCGCAREIASTPSVRPSARADRARDVRRALVPRPRPCGRLGAELVVQALVQPFGAGPVRDGVDQQRAAALDRRLRDAAAVRVVRAGEHRVERLARLVVGEPRRRRADLAALPVDDLERAAAHAQQFTDAGEDLVQRLLQPRLRGDGVLVPALPHPWPLRGHHSRGSGARGVRTGQGGSRATLGRGPC